MIWEDLSDDELEARLTQRGVTPGAAHWLVRHRDDPWAVAEIDQRLA